MLPCRIYYKTKSTSLIKYYKYSLRKHHIFPLTFNLHFSNIALLFLIDIRSNKIKGTEIKKKCVYMLGLCGFYNLYFRMTDVGCCLNYWKSKNGSCIGTCMILPVSLKAEL